MTLYAHGQRHCYRVTVGPGGKINQVYQPYEPAGGCGPAQSYEPPCSACYDLGDYRFGSSTEQRFEGGTGCGWRGPRKSYIKFMAVPGATKITASVSESPTCTYHITLSGPCASFIASPSPPEMSPPPPSPTPPAPSPVDLPVTGAVILDGGAGRFSRGHACVTNAASSQIDHMPIVAQCCEPARTTYGQRVPETCRRFVGSNDDVGCISGHAMWGHVRASTYAEAVGLCTSKGLQLCSGACKDQGCGYNDFPVWT